MVGDAENVVQRADFDGIVARNRLKMFAVFQCTDAEVTAGLPDDFVAERLEEFDEFKT